MTFVQGLQRNAHEQNNKKEQSRVRAKYYITRNMNKTFDNVLLITIKRSKIWLIRFKKIKKGNKFPLFWILNTSHNRGIDFSSKRKKSSGRTFLQNKIFASLCPRSCSLDGHTCLELPPSLPILVPPAVIPRYWVLFTNITKHWNCLCNYVQWQPLTSCTCFQRGNVYLMSTEKCLKTKPTIDWYEFHTILFWSKSIESKPNEIVTGKNNAVIFRFVKDFVDVL